MLPDESLVRILRCNDPVNAVAITPDGKKASSSSSWTLKVWDLQTGIVISTLKGHNRSVYAVAITPDGKIELAPL